MPTTTTMAPAASSRSRPTVGPGVASAAASIQRLECQMPTASRNVNASAAMGGPGSCAHRRITSGTCSCSSRATASRATTMSCILTAMTACTPARNPCHGVSASAAFRARPKPTTTMAPIARPTPSNLTKVMTPRRKAIRPGGSSHWLNQPSRTVMRASQFSSRSHPAPSSRNQAARRAMR